MNQAQLRSLSKSQRENLKSLLDKIEAGEHLRKSDVGRIGEEDAVIVHTMDRRGVAEAFGVDPSTVGRWGLSNKAGRYDLAEIIEEKLSDGQGGDELYDLKVKSLKTNIRKVEKEIEQKDEQIRKLREEVIPVEEHKAILVDRAHVFQAVWRESVRRCINDFVEKPRDELFPIMENLRSTIMLGVRTSGGFEEEVENENQD